MRNGHFDEGNNQDRSRESALRRIIRLVGWRSRPTSTSPSVTSKPLSRESSRRFHVTLSISSEQDSNPHQPPADLGDGPAVLEEQLRLPRPSSFEEPPESRTPDSRDIPATPSEEPPPIPAYQQTLEISFPQRLDGTFPGNSLSQPSTPKKDVQKARPVAITFSLVALLGTACVYFALIFSLPNFPYYSHIFFSVALLVEVTYMVKKLWDHSRYIKQRRMAMEDGLPGGLIIQGAANWINEPDPVAPTSDLEAATSVPPPYGTYRGSVRIHDSDIAWVQNRQVLEYRINSMSQVLHSAPSVETRPPQYN